MQLTFKGRKVENLHNAMESAISVFSKDGTSEGRLYKDNWSGEQLRKVQHLQYMLCKAAQEYGLTEVTLNDEETLLIFGVTK